MTIRRRDVIRIKYAAFTPAIFSCFPHIVSTSVGLASSDHHIFLQVYENLVRYDANSGEYVNVLATDYAISEDGLDWTFHLR